MSQELLRSLAAIVLPAVARERRSVGPIVSRREMARGQQRGFPGPKVASEAFPVISASRSRIVFSALTFGVIKVYFRASSQGSDTLAKEWGRWRLRGL